MLHEILGFLCLECVTTSIVSYVLWEYVPQTSTSNTMRALTVFGAGMAAKPVVGIFSGFIH